MSGPSRPLPIEAILTLGMIGVTPYSIAFLRGCAEDGYSLEQEGDELLSDEEWNEVVTIRARVLAAAWKVYEKGLPYG